MAELTKDKIYGLIFGCALGDAAAVPYEGQSAEYIAERFTLENLPLLSSNKKEEKASWHNVENNDWSDDTDQLILLYDVIKECKGSFSPTLFAQKIYNWRHHGFSELGDLCGAGMGQLTAAVTAHPKFLENPFLASKEVWERLGSKSAPNGAIMRAGISAVANNWVNTAIEQAKITHHDDRCVRSSICLAYICKKYLRNEHPNMALIKSMLPDFPYWDFDKIDFSGDHRGYTYITLAAGLWTVEQITAGNTDFKNIMRRLTYLGGDTDTNCAVAGQILGSYLGFDRLPKDWIATLKHTDWLLKRLDR